MHRNIVKLEMDPSLSLPWRSPLPKKVEVKQVNGDKEDATFEPVGSLRVSSTTDSTKVDNNSLKSKLLPNAVIDRYLEWVKKLRAELKWVT